MGEGREVDVEDLVAGVEEVGDAVFASCWRVLLMMEDRGMLVKNARAEEASQW